MMRNKFVEIPQYVAQFGRVKEHVIEFCLPLTTEQFSVPIFVNATGAVVNQN
jgi:hypothetical protein